MMVLPGDDVAVAAASRGHLRASRADREQVLGALETAFAAGLLTKAEFDLAADRTLASRTYADLAAVTASLEAQPSRAQPSQAQPSQAQPSQVQPSQAQPSPAQRACSSARPCTRPGNAAAWGVCGLIVTVFLTVVIVPSGTTKGVVAVTAVVVYAVLWLLAGIIVLASRHRWLPFSRRPWPRRSGTAQRR